MPGSGPFRMVVVARRQDPGRTKALYPMFYCSNNNIENLESDLRTTKATTNTEQTPIIQSEIIMDQNKTDSNNNNNNQNKTDNGKAVQEVNQENKIKEESGDGANKKQGNWIENLPKPPVPDIQTTLKRYLDGLRPVLTAEQYERTARITEEFLNSNKAYRLQKLLESYAERSENWVTDCWLDDMYLINPLPLVINSSPFYLLPPKQCCCKQIDEMIQLAAELVWFSLEFKQKIDQQSLEQDRNRNGRWLCMRTYRNLFTGCRMPGREKDWHWNNYNCKNNGDGGGQHFVVAIYDQYYVVHLNEEQPAGPNQFERPSKPTPSIEQLRECLLRLWNQETDRRKNGHQAPKIGIFTTENRRTWAKIQQGLITLDEVNEKNIGYLKNSLFILCLDHSIPVKQNGNADSPSTEEKENGQEEDKENEKKNAVEEVERSRAALMLMHGGGSRKHTANRWWDKCLQMIVSMDGYCGLIVEHSFSEGMTALNFLEQFLEFQMEPKKLNGKDGMDGQRSLISLETEALEWRIDLEVEDYLVLASHRINKLIRDVDLAVIKYEQYGREFIKNRKISPDVYIQIAMQLTYYKLYGRLVSTYESCSLREFNNGRVDNIRASSDEALQLARSFFQESNVNNNITELKINLFKQAVQKQTEILKYTSEGMGPDNHLLELRELSKLHLITVPELFLDDSYREYINFRLSTSQLYTNKDILVGYGPVVPDGYGCSYNPNNDFIMFCISSFKSGTPKQKNPKKFGQCLATVLNQMKQLVSII